MITADQRRDLLAVTRTRITDFPDTHDQSEWLASEGIAFQLDYTVGNMATDELGHKVDGWLRCDTTACFAGHLVAAAIEAGHIDIDDEALRAADIGEVAARLLGGHRDAHAACGGVFDGGMSAGQVLAWVDRQLRC